MVIKPFQPRHKVHQLSNGIQVILPSKKNYFFIIWCVLGLIMWTYITGGVVYITRLLLIGLGNSNGFMWIIAGFLAFALLFLIGWGAYAIYLLLWQFTGKEIFIIENGVFRISRQTFKRNVFLEYSTNNVSDLRASISHPSVFPLGDVFQNLSGQNGMIAFDYGAKTIRFGFEIEEAEAKQIVSVLQESLSKSKAG